MDTSNGYHAINIFRELESETSLVCTRKIRNFRIGSAVSPPILNGGAPARRRSEGLRDGA